MIKKTKLNFRKLQTLANYLLKVPVSKVPPLFVYLWVTRKCNLRCKMCLWVLPQENLENSMQNEMSEEEIKQLCDQITGLGTDTIAISGGEPFLRKDILQIIEYIKQKNRLCCNILTNGTLISPAIAKELIRLEVDRVFISIDGIGKTHDFIRGKQGSYDAAIKGLVNIYEERRRLGKSLPETIINCIVSNENFDQIEQIIKIGHALGVSRVNFGYLSFVATDEILQTKEMLGTVSIGIPFSSGETLLLDDNQVKDFSQRLKRISHYYRNKGIKIRVDRLIWQRVSWLCSRSNISNCLFTYISTFISPDEKVIPCPMLPGYNVGDLKESPISKIWNGERYRKFRYLIARKNLPVCRKCSCHAKTLSGYLLEKIKHNL